MRERLVAFARRFPDPDAEIWLIFDGARPAENPERGERPKLRLQFAPSADDWIVARVREEPDPSRIAVVSGDRKLTGRTRHHGAAAVSPRLFLDHCTSNKG
ncbi:MAG: NYN domain-containing protein, partial [Deltaproteobacteria bacterium]|nr:NYN domain-containing protein [Deltaproteobacteria bacterium]